MSDNEIEYLNYPIIILNPAKKQIPWQKELEKDFFFYTVSDPQECLKIVTTKKNITAIVCDQIENDKLFWKEIKKKSPEIKIYSFLPVDHYIQFRSYPSKTLPYHPLLSSIPSDVLYLEFAQTIERYVWKEERDFLLSIKRQERWFSLMGQLTREWAHEIKNNIAIISLNAEISIAKAQKLSLLKPFGLENMKKIIVQCQKISGTLDGVRKLTKVSQPGLSSLPLSETIEQAISMVETKNGRNQKPIKKIIPGHLSLSYTESILLRSALVNILRYFNQIKSDQTLISILIQEKESSFSLKVLLNNISSQSLPFNMEYVNGPIKKIVHMEKKKRNFYIGVRLLKSLGGEISTEKNEAEKLIALQALLPFINTNINTSQK